MKIKKRLHLGVLFSSIDNICQYEIWRGIVKYAEEKDIHLTAFISTYQTIDYDFTSHVETCFENIKNSKAMDGLIIFSGFIAQIIGVEEFERQTKNIPSNVPVVSVSYHMPGIPSVLIDNKKGIYSVVDHLIKCHGKKKIAFIKGPDGHHEAEERFEGYKAALEDNGIPFDDNYVFPGEFSQDSGHAAVDQMIHVREFFAEAIAASDDETALGVINDLRERNIVVPADIAVTGFDDERFSATYIPSISTARQDFFGIGMVSAETIYKKINGEPVDEVNYVAPSFVARQSCGCLEKEFENIKTDLEEVSAETDSLMTYALRHIVPLFPKSILQPKLQEWIKIMVDKIMEKPFQKDNFLYLFDEILVSFNYHSHDFSIWHDVLNVLTMGVELHHDEVECPHAILSTLISATMLINDICVKEVKTEEFILNDARLNLRRVASSLVLNFDIDSLAEEMHNSLGELSINTALIGLYKHPIKSDEADADRTIDTLIGFDGDMKFNEKNNSWNPILFSDYTTIDKFEFERERRALLFIPLFFREEELGVILLPFSEDIPVDAYETLRVNISTAVKGAELISRIQTLSITDELTGLLNRRGFFQFSYSRLLHLERNAVEIPIVMFMDMDGLKYINDTYGHSEGDIAISAFAKVLKESLREEDIIGRIGGDEFVVLSSVKSEKNAEMVVQRIRTNLEAYNNKKLHRYDVASSIGNVILEEANKKCFEAAMLSADNVLYEEKMDKKKRGISRR